MAANIDTTGPVPKTKSKVRAPGWYIPWLFVLPFLVIFTVNGLLVYFAVTSFSGLTSAHASAEGAVYNDALAAARAQAERGWRVEVAFASTGARHGTLEVTLRDRDGRPLTGAEATARFLRPTSAGADRALPLVERGNGRYGADIELGLPGVWDLRLVVHHPAGSFQKIERVWVKA